MSVYKRGKGTHWHYYFRVRGVRYRGSIPEARTKKDAEQAESKIKQDVFEGRYGKRDTGTMTLASFIDDIYMPWAKSNKTSWLNDHYNAVTLKNYFGEKKLKEIQPLDVERFKSKRLATETKHVPNKRRHQSTGNLSCCRGSITWLSKLVRLIPILV